MPSIVTRPVITSMAPAIRLNWRTVVAVTWGWRQWKSVTISTIGEFRCGLRVVVLHNATLHDNGPPHLIFGEGIVFHTPSQRDESQGQSLSIAYWRPIVPPYPPSRGWHHSSSFPEQ